MKKSVENFMILWILFWRELKSYFLSPMAYILSSIFLLVTGFIFSISIETTGEATLRHVLGPLAFLTLMMIPMISMRLIAEERRMGTLEVLLTSPVHTLQVIWAKFLGGWFFFLTLLLPTGAYLLLFEYYQASWDGAETLTFYLGLALLGGAYLSIGLFISGCTENQIVAAFVTFFILLLIYLLNWVDIYLPQTSFSRICAYLSWNSHLNSFKKGILDSQDSIYFLAIIVYFNMLAAWYLDWKRESSW